MKILIISEKPSVTQSIVNAISNVTAVKKNGYYEDKNYIYTNALGHLIQTKMPVELNPKYEKFDFNNLPLQVNLLDYIKNYKVVPNKKEHFNMIKNLTKRKDVTSIINACDPDREGELIFRLIYEYANCSLPFEKIILKDMTKEGIKNAFNSPQKGENYNSLRNGAYARSFADYYVGLNITQAISIKKGELNSVGRVQTPTLKLIVERTIQNKKYTKTLKYAIVGIIENKYNFILKNKEFDDLNEAKNTLTKLPGLIEITKNTKKTKKHPPALPDLLYIQKIANQKYSFTAEQTLNIIQSLYEKHKMVTYPRTDCRFVTSETTKKLNSIVYKFKNFDYFKFTTSTSVNNQVVGEVTAHEAITPTGILRENISDEEKKVFDIILRIFLSNFSNTYEFIENNFVFETTEGSFNYSNKTLIDNGYVNIFQNINHKYIEESDTLKEGKFKPVYKIKKIETSPPKLFTEGTLLSKMENVSKTHENKEEKEILKKIGGIGTAATRGAIIEKLKKRNFIALKGKNILCTQKGFDLIQTLDKLNLNITNIEFTAYIENNIKAIVDCELTNAEFEKIIKNYIKEELEKITKLPQVERKNNKINGKCPICGGNIINISKSKSYFCSNYKEKSCKFLIWKVMNEKKISNESVEELLKNKKTRFIKGFKSKSGQDYMAKLIIKDDFSIEIIEITFLKTYRPKK